VSLITSDKRRIIIGLGQTGQSIARFFARRGLPFAACDTRESGTAIDTFKLQYPDVELQTGPLNGEWLSQADELVISPGVAKDQPAIQSAIASGAKLIGDIDLFAREVTAPIIAITGSNGKSTVTTLVWQMAVDAGCRAEIGGNIGIPVLDLLAKPSAELYVLELSSFQLETTHDLKASAATVLNMSADHMDRYDGMQGYHAAKHRIYRHCQQAIFNREDPLSRPLVPNSTKQISFGLGAPDLNQYGRLMVAGKPWLAKGAEALMPVHDMKMRGEHNELNALAALALCESQGLDQASLLKTLSQFPGLEHRCQWIAEQDGVSWFNDSKGTNLGATLAAVVGLGETQEHSRSLILIAGGQAKGQDFSYLKDPAKRYLKSLILIGEDRQQMASEISFETTYFADSLKDAVRLAKSQAESGDAVLLSPACASFDMFSGFEDRGHQFVAAVKEVLSCD
jgi:UDP-N-acetylmuramoylalanine--D-glutamate ligase